MSEKMYALISAMCNTTGKLEYSKKINTSVKEKNVSRGTDKQATLNRVYANFMDGRVTHTNSAFGCSEIGRFTASVVCMKALKNVEGKSLPVTSCKDFVDLLMFLILVDRKKGCVYKRCNCRELC